MRVALITDGISPYVLGGMQKHSFYLAKYLAKNHVHVDLFHYNDSVYDIAALEFFTPEEKQFITSVPLHFPTSAKFPGHYIYKSYLYSCRVFNAIKDKLSTYDFIYTKGFTGWKLIAEKRKGAISCCKIGVKFHGYEMFQIAPDPKSKLQQQLLKPFVKKISQRADVVFSYGGKITEIIRSIGVKADHIVEIPSGVEKEFISPAIATHPEPYRKFIFLGRAERRKGIIELNEVLKQLMAENRNFRFEFIGPIPAENKLQHSSITYHGEIRDVQKIKSLLAQQDVLVCPSWSEGFPNVILEGMACGLAIIATNVGAVAAMVNPNNGWLIEPADKEALYAAMTEAIDEKELSPKKEASLASVRNTFNWDIISEKLIDAISR